MHLEFIDLLRCPRTHEESWLVAAIDRMDGRLIIEGKLGCPVCGAAYRIERGVALFDEESESVPAPSEKNSISESAATTIAALLDLSSSGKIALLAGEWASSADAVAQLTGSRIVALNSPVADAASDVVAAIRAAPPIPLASRSLDGIALGERYSTPAMLDEAGRLLRPRGRLLAQAAAQLPPTFRELARDANYVVAEFVGELISLRR